MDKKSGTLQADAFFCSGEDQGAGALTIIGYNHCKIDPTDKIGDRNPVSNGSTVRGDGDAVDASQIMLADRLNHLLTNNPFQVEGIGDDVCLNLGRCGCADG